MLSLHCILCSLGLGGNEKLVFSNKEASQLLGFINVKDKLYENYNTDSLLFALGLAEWFNPLILQDIFVRSSVAEVASFITGMF